MASTSEAGRKAQTDTIAPESKKMTPLRDNDSTSLMVDHLVLLAWDRKGKAFGEYVRNLILDLSSKSVNVWFQSEADVKLYLNDLNTGAAGAAVVTRMWHENKGDLVDAFHADPLEAYKWKYLGKAMWLSVKKKLGGLVVMMYIHLCPTLPVIDFDVNHITVNPHTGVYDSLGCYADGELVKMITARKAVMLDDFMEGMKAPMIEKESREDMIQRGQCLVRLGELRLAGFTVDYPTSST
jgi:hypothetical protein